MKKFIEPKIETVNFEENVILKVSPADVEETFPDGRQDQDNM